MRKTVYGIAPAAFAADIFGGTGGLHASAGWHPIGHRIVYTGDSLAACALEILVNYGDDALAKKWVWASAVVPSEIISSAPALPAGWQGEWGLTQPIGAGWLMAKTSAVLEVPSRVSLATFNYLLNPEHPDFSRIELGAAGPYEFNSRLHSEARRR